MIEPAVARLFAPVVGLFLVVALVVAVLRVIRAPTAHGPALLDRLIATDVMLATMICGLGAFVAFTGRKDVLTVMVVLSLFGFVGSVAVSRYVARTPSSDYSFVTHDETDGTASDSGASDSGAGNSGARDTGASDGGSGGGVHI